MGARRRCRRAVARPAGEGATRSAAVTRLPARGCAPHACPMPWALADTGGCLRLCGAGQHRPSHNHPSLEHCEWRARRGRACKP